MHIHKEYTNNSKTSYNHKGVEPSITTTTTTIPTTATEPATHTMPTIAKEPTGTTTMV
jgi:hypothetical protein